ncbi:hypothetical protein OsJ_29374 [Oryza sativa Japonica Group]|uniref:Uncharacterized protein n=1 Tax=Oryza sativa subsp. japonica TaxID=39947 RepID=B9G3L1_ORYSJ|nr:hypothetical protein OsJ_29374 [Oryza sativa Japonica Group]
MAPTPEIYPSALGLFAGRRWEAHGGREEMEAARWWRSRRIYDGDDLGTAKGEGRATRANELGKRPTGFECGMMAAMTELCASVEDDVSEYTSNTNVFLPPPSLCDDELSHNLLHFLPFSSLPPPSLCEHELRHNLLPFYHRWPSPPSLPSANALKDGGRVTSAPMVTSGDGRRERKDFVDNLLDTAVKCMRTASLIYTLSTGEEPEDERPILDMAQFRQEMEVLDDGTAMPMDSAPNSSLDVDKILKVLDVNCLTEDGVPL